MGLETPVVKDVNTLRWESRAQKEQSSLGASIMKGNVTVEQARRVQRERTKHLTSENFDLNWAVEYYHQTGGLVYKDGQLIAGEPVDSIFQRKAEMIQNDRIQEAAK